MSTYTDELKVKVERLELENKKLLEEVAFLECLRCVGVDNWCGYEEAQEIMEMMKNEI